MVYRMLSAGLPTRTEQRASIYSLISELDVPETNLMMADRIMFTPEDEISMSIEYYSSVTRYVLYYYILF